MSSGFFRGTNTEQDSRWGDAEKKLLRRTKFSKVLEQKVNMKKVNMEVMQRWIAQRITSLLGFEDDIVVGTCVNYLSEKGKLDPKKLQLQLTGFLEKSTGMFMEELWGLLVDAQNSLGGIPSAFLQDKKEEMLQAKEQERKQEDELRQKLMEHEQEMEHTALPTSTSSTEVNGTSSSSIPGIVSELKPTEGRRASRWGNSLSVVNAAQVATMPTVDAAATFMRTGIDDETALEGSAPSTFGEGPVEHGVGNGASESDEDSDKQRDRSSSDILGSPEKSRKHSRSRRDDRDQDEGKERKRKSKGKHGRKSERKKSKSGRRRGEGKDRRHKDKGDNAAGVSRMDDEVSSSDGDDDEEENIATGIEEALRLKALASVASKRGQPTQDDS